MNATVAMNHSVASNESIMWPWPWLTCVWPSLTDVKSFLWTTGLTVAVAGPLLYDLGPKVIRYRFRLFILYLAYAIVAVLVMLPTAIWRPADADNMRVPAVVMAGVERLLGLQISLEGLEHLEPGRPYVVVANHQHALDLLVMLALWPYLGPTSPVAKKELLTQTGPVGLAGYLVGMVFIDRSDGHGSTDKVLAAAKQPSKSANSSPSTRPHSLFLFPEGTRFHSRGELLRFKLGAFRAAITNQLPVLPVVISHYDFLDTSAPYFEPGGHVTLSVLPPVDATAEPFANGGENGIRMLANHVRQAMLDCYKLS